MNLPRLRELAKAGKAGTLRPEEAKELFEALPGVLSQLDDAVKLLRELASIHRGFTRGKIDAFFLRHSS
jgi:hypothetical protein